MGEEKGQKNEEKDRAKKKQKPEVPLPFCTTASDPEHARGYEIEEPCDDARAGEIGSTDEQEEATIENEAK